MIERVTALLAQSAATIIAVTGFVGLLAYTHTQAFRAGETKATETANFNPPVIEPVPAHQPQFAATAYPGQGQVATGAPQVDSRPTTVLPASAQGTVTVTAQGIPPDPPPNLGGPVLGSEGLPVSDGISGTPISPPPGPVGPGTGTGSGPVYVPNPGADICYSLDPNIGDSDIARCWLRVGDAYQSVGRMEQARVAWDEALLIGARVGGAQASLMAQQRLQSAVLARSCPANPDSLSRIANGFDRDEINGEIISLRARQDAMRALGYYNAEVDGEYGPSTRRAVRDFQADMGFDQTGALNAQETVDLVCHAAITARDPGAQNLLGIMFATGLGVELNVDMATEWLEIAAARDQAEANFNLALIYGTGTIEGSYRLCGIVESPERADAYLRRAAELDHRRARSIRSSFGTGGSPAERWNRIEDRLLRQAQDTGDRFYLAWQRRLEEAELRAVRGASQPGCYLDPVD